MVPRQKLQIGRDVLGRGARAGQFLGAGEKVHPGPARRVRVGRVEKLRVLLRQVVHLLGCKGRRAATPLRPCGRARLAFQVDGDGHQRLSVQPPLPDASAGCWRGSGERTPRFPPA